MKNFFYLFILLAFYSANSYSQINWTQQVGSTYENLNGVYMVNSNVSYAVGNNGTVLKTTNGGTTWTAKSFPASSTNLSVYFQNELTGFIGNQNAFIYKTVDGGNNWEMNGAASTYAVTSVVMTTSTNGFCGDHYGNLQRSTDNGQTWYTQFTMPGYDSKIFFSNDNRGWAVDTYGYVSYTVNGGYNWSSVRISTDTLSSVYFISSSIGYAAGDSGRVFKTTNSGTNWSLLNTGTTAKLNSVYAQSLTNIYACGNAGTFIYSTNGGTSWVSAPQGTQNLKNMNFIPSTIIGNMVGDLGTIYRTSIIGYGCIGTGNTPVSYPFFTYWMDARTDMLFTASELASYGVMPGQITGMGFYFSSADTLTMNGFNIKIQHSALTALTGFTSSGWTTVYSGTYKVPGTGMRYINFQAPYFLWDGISNLLVEICFNNSAYTNSSNVYSTDAPNMTYHQHTDLPSGDGCTGITTGTLQPTRPNICFTQTITGTGNSGKLVPDNFYLSQNYPNPFNPVTKIKYGLAKNSFVSLKVFDVLGREIKTLVNAQMNAGEYIVDFNGSDLPSGTYFYRLETGSFTDTKKLILLK